MKYLGSLRRVVWGSWEHARGGAVGGLRWRSRLLRAPPAPSARPRLPTLPPRSAPGAPGSPPPGVPLAGPRRIRLQTRPRAAARRSVGEGVGGRVLGGGAPTRWTRTPQRRRRRRGLSSECPGAPASPSSFCLIPLRWPLLQTPGGPLAARGRRAELESARL